MRARPINFIEAGMVRSHRADIVGHLLDRFLCCLLFFFFTAFNMASLKCSHKRAFSSLVKPLLLMCSFKRVAGRCTLGPLLLVWLMDIARKYSSHCQTTQSGSRIVAWQTKASLRLEWTLACCFLPSPMAWWNCLLALCASPKIAFAW